MKAASFAPPLVSLLAAAAWLIPQQHSVSALREQNESLRQQLAGRISTLEADPSQATARATREPKAKAPLDWKKIAANASLNSGDMSEQMHFQQRLGEMTSAELLAAFDEIHALDLPSASVNYLEQVLLNALVQLDPQLALDHFLDRLQDPRSQLSWSLANAFSTWSEKDLSAATAWFDQQIIAGKFATKSLDGKSRARSQFESALMTRLLVADPDAAATRIAGIPTGQRGEILQSVSFEKFTNKDQENFAAIVRDQLPEKEQPAAVAQPAGRIASQDGYLKVTDYLDRIAATPADRAQAINTVGGDKISSLGWQRKITRTDLDEFREWAVTQSPATVDKTTGELLADAAMNGHSYGFSEMSAIAVDYQENGGTEEVLATFLESWAARANKETSRDLAEKISDPARREKILKQLK